MATDKRSALPVMVGISSLVVIFAVLCLTVFALLSISTVRANQRLSDKASAAVENYYAADCAAEQILAQLREGKIPPGVKEENGIYIYNCPVSDTQTLAVAVAVDGADYTVLRWQAVSTAQWQAEDDLPVWTAE